MRWISFPFSRRSLVWPHIHLLAAEKKTLLAEIFHFVIDK